MKKTLFLSAILGAALCSSAFAAETTTATVSGNNNTNLNLNAAQYAVDKVIFDMTGNGTSNYFASNAQTYSQAIQIGNGTDTQGLMINNGYGNVVTFTGKVTGSGTLQKTGAGSGLNIVFAGDATDYTGAINLSANSNAAFTLRFGGDDVTAAASTSDKGVSGTGTITFKNAASNTLEYKYNAAEAPVYITNTITKSGNGVTSKVNFLGGAAYILTKDATIDEMTLGADTNMTVAEGATLTLGTTVDVNIAETKKSEGNGFGSIVINRQIASGTVNASTVTTWKVNGTTDASLSYDSTTNTLTGDTRNTTNYYINNASETWELNGATKVVVNAANGVIDLGSGTYSGVTDKLIINAGAIVTTSHTGQETFMPANVDINAGGKLVVTGQDFCGWSQTNKTITLTGESKDLRAILELNNSGSATMVMNLAMNGHSTIGGTGKFNTFACNFVINGTDNILSSGLAIRNDSTLQVNDNAELTITGTIERTPQFSGTLTKTGNGLLTITGDITGGSINGGNVNKTTIRDNTITGGTFRNVTFSNSTLNGAITVTGATGDGNLQRVLNGLTKGTSASITLDGGEYVLMTNDADTKGFNLTFNGDSRINGNRWRDGGHVFEVLGGSAVTVNGNLKIESKANVTLTNGSLTTSSITMGHNETGSGDAKNVGILTMASGSITTGFIKKNTGYDDSDNTFTMTGGTLTFTKPASETTTPEEGDPVTTTYNAIDGVTATISGGTLSTEQAAWQIDNANVSIGGVTISGANEATLKNVTLTASLTADTAITFGGAIKYTGDTETRNKALTEGNGFGIIEKYATIATGSGAITNEATWTMGDLTAQLTNKELTAQSGNNTKYYVNTAAEGLDITGATELLVKADASLATGTYNLSSHAEVTNGATLTVGAGTTLTAGTYLEVRENSTMNINGAVTTTNSADNYGMWLHNGATVAIAEDATLTVQGMTFQNGTITATGDTQIGGSTLSIPANATITGADITVTSGNIRDYNISGGSVTVASNAETTINSALSATTALTVNSGSTANLNAAGTTAAAVTVNGDLTVKAASTVKQLGGLGTVKALADLTVTEAEDAKVTLGGMEIAGNTTVTVNDHAGTLTLGSLTVTGSGSTINADLDLSGATVTLNGNSVTLGCDLKFDGTAITLSDDDIAAISGAGLLLFSDVESLTLGTTTHTTDYIGLVDASGIILTLAGDATSALPDKVFVNFSATDKTVSLSVVPEPATATLSLLALAALAARRRRH